MGQNKILNTQLRSFSLRSASEADKIIPIKK